MEFNADLASALASLPLAGLEREYPNKLDHVINGAGDLRSPKELHPAFYGCFDWHSSVHGHWMLIYLLKRYRLAEEASIRALLNRSLTSQNLAIEAAYLNQPNRGSFERPYGWGWLLKLADELSGWDDADGKTWAGSLAPLQSAIVERFFDFLPRQRYPVRVGTHANTAFALGLAYDFAINSQHLELKFTIEKSAMLYFGKDSDLDIQREPSGADFLSPSLVEADLMRRILPAERFSEWFHNLIPSIAPAHNVLEPVDVSDRTDPQIGHLDGLNLSRAWCMFGIASALPIDDPIRALLFDSANRHAEVGLKHVNSGDYMGEHWLATFAVYMLASSTLETLRNA